MKLRTAFICQQCGNEYASWFGKCPNCGTWNSLVETIKESPRSPGAMVRGTGVVAKPQKLSEVRHIEKNRLKSGFIEFDRVMGGGIVPGSVTLLAGDPGIGKSTLLLHVIAKCGGVYVSGEESAEQIKLRAKRLGIEGANISVLSETNVESIASALEAIEEKSLVIIDSIQTLSSSDLDGMAGSVGQIRHCAEVLLATAKSKAIPMIIIGHVTKEGTIAGPKVLEHMVDTVLYLEGERFANARILRTFKNRFGAVEEVGIFEMDEKGLKEISNPSALFLQDRVKNVPGSIVTVVMEGTRPMLVEIQALTVSSQLAMPRRVANGIDYNRLQLIVAILQKRLNVAADNASWKKSEHGLIRVESNTVAISALGSFDIFVNVSGGMKIDEPAADLAVAMAILSSFKNKPLDSKTAVFGEVGLLGEVRSIGSDERRTKEAHRLGFTTVISPKSVKNVRQASEYLR